MKILFTGFDSAWGGRVRGATCNLAGEVVGDKLELKVRERPRSVDWAQAVEESRTAKDTNHIFSIDQGLVVPNATGMRPVERNLASALMAGYGCGAHASNHARSSCYGSTAGIWDLTESLEAMGYRHEPMAVASRSSGRMFFECYPHPALIGLFNLDRVLPYKVSRGTADGWRQLLDHLRSLKGADLPIANIEEHVPVDLAWTKANEDGLDALVAAYIAAYFWWYGTARSVVLGDMTSGYIVTPCNERMRSRFVEVFGEASLNVAGTARAVRPRASAGPTSMNAPSENAAPGTRSSGPSLHSTVELVANDKGNLWCSVNEWMQRERCDGWRLDVEFVDLDGTPTLTFLPFRSQTSQGGMRPADDDTKSEWAYIASGASNATPRTHRVRHSYVQL